MVRAISNLIKTSAWPLGVFGVTRLGLVLLVYWSLVFLPQNPDVKGFQAFPDNRILNGWARWDAGWYLGIAAHGYPALPAPGEPNGVVFFPLYPILIAGVNLLIHNGAASALLVSNAAFVIALVLLYRLTSECYGDFTARWTVLLLAIFPFSFYFSAAYSESVFLLAVVGAFYFGQRKKWFLAALFAMAASAARAVGVTVALGLVLLYLSTVQFRLRQVRRDILWLALAPLGLIAYMGYLGIRFNDPLLFITSRNVTGWEAGRTLAVAWDTVISNLTSIQRLVSGAFVRAPMDLFHIGLSVVALILLVVAWRRLSIAHVIWAIVCVVISFLNGWGGMGRYLLPIFPVFIAVPLLIKRENVLTSIAYVSVLFMALFAVMYSHWYWVS